MSRNLETIFDIGEVAGQSYVDRDSGENGYDFTVSAKENVFFTLSELDRDLDLYVIRLDDDGKPVIDDDGVWLNAGVSSNPGLEDESIFLQLDPGQWRVYVWENLGANLSDSLSDGNFDYRLEIDPVSFFG